MPEDSIHTILNQEMSHNDRVHLSSDGNLNLDTSLNVDDDLLDGLGRSVKTLVDYHVSKESQRRIQVSSRILYPLQQVLTYSIKRLWMRIS